MAKQKDHPPHSFFKVFIGLDGPAHPFVVPPSYVKAVGGVLQSEYILEGPRGELRVVEVKKNGCQWFFRGGWRPFMEEYSLKFGDFLFFTLDHNSNAKKLHFQVYGINGYLKKMGGSRNSFYKIFTGQAHRFRLPPPYVKAIGGVLRGEYILRGPTGEHRIVEVERNGEFWFFRGGWGAFVEEYPLSYGDILVFTLHSNAELHFQVYERNGCLKKLSTSGAEKGKHVKGQSSEKGTNSFGWVSARLVKELDSIRCDPKYGRLLDLYLGYEAYEDEEMEESSAIEISSSSSDSQYGTCNESNDEEIVVSCKRAKTAAPELDDESKPVVQPSSSLKKVDLNDASAKVPDNSHVDSVNPVRNPNYCRHSQRKNSIKPNLYPKNEVHHMDEEIQDRSNVKREESVDIKVVANWQPSSMIYTTVRCSPEQRDKLIRSAQRLKLGRPLAAVTLSASCTKNGVMHLPKLFFQTLFNGEQLKAMVRKGGRLTTSANGNYWPVEFVFSKGRVRMMCGWSACVRQNGLREGDFCFFQFIKTEPFIELRLSISHPRKRKTHEALNTSNLFTV